MRAALPLALCALAAAGCDPAPKPDATPAQQTTAAAPPPTAAEPPPPPPTDLDVAELKAALKCPAEAKSGPCAVLAKMSSCTPWSASVPSGDGRWLGRGWVVAEGKTTEAFMGLRLKTVPTSEVGPGQLPLKIGLAEITKESSDAHANADRALRAFERGDVPPRASPTLTYLKERSEWPDAPARRTQGGHVFAVAQGGAYYCEGPKRTVLAVQQAETRRGSGDGIYAELWATSW